MIQSRYGWDFLCKELADYCNVSMFDIYERNVRECLYLVDVIQAKIKLMKNGKGTT